MSPIATDLISHPQILRAAWRRVRHWYAYGDQPPEPIYSSWLADEDGWLQALSEHIKSGASQYLHLPLIPYPKQGVAVRHFCRPAVEVQVYFTAIAVLLAPWLEQCMPPCSFANRWYRGLYRNKASNGKSVWQNRPFVLEDRYAYQPYPRAYGLFRRVAHWTSQAMVGEAPNNANALTGSKAAIPDDYAEGYLPDFVRNEWWEKKSKRGSTASTRGYWAEIDLQLAYPSVKISVLRNCLMDMVAEENLSAQQEREVDYPKDNITEQLQEFKTRQTLVTILCDALEKVTYDTKDAPGNLWLPPDIDRPMPIDSGEGHPGLPTGLVISGLLLNAYLNPVDKAMMDWCNSGKCGGKGAFLRFADDMRIMTRSPETLFEGMDELWSAICSIGVEATETNTAPAGLRATYLSRPDASNQSNLRINLTKLGPKPVRDVAEAYLRADGRTKQDKNDQLQPPQKIEPLADTAPHCLLDWWKTNKSESQEDALKREALTAGNLNAFVTHLVERMSELGGETLQERFGAEARQRLTDLHQLVRFEIDDKQVKKATRLSFGTGKLVRAWLPEADENEDRKLISEIRESVGMALRQAPWKTSLWRSVLRAAVRRPGGKTAQSREDDKRNADEWLKKQLELIQHRGRVEEDKSGHDLAWHSIWPEEAETPAKCDDGKDKNRKSLSLSAHRAAFWFALRDTITDLDRAITATAKRQAEPLPERHREWASQEWTFRAMPQEKLLPTRTWLAQLEVWCDMLYPPSESCSYETTKGLQECSLYEIEALSLAVLRCEEPSRLLNSNPQRHKSSDIAPSAKRPYENIVSGWARWAIACSRPDDDKLRAWGARLLPGKSVPIRQYPHHNLGRPLLPFGLLQIIPLWQHTETLTQWLEPNTPNSHKNVIARLRQLQMQRCFPESAHQVLSRRTQDRFTELQGIIDAPSKKKPENLWLLREYAWARRALLGVNDTEVASRNGADHFSLHRLLWSNPWKKLPDAAIHWAIEPASVAAVGLPLRIACRLLEHALRMQCKTTRTTLGNPPVWRFKGSEEGSPGFWLAAGRQCQFEEEQWESFKSLSVPQAYPLPSTRSALWLQCMEPEERRDAWEVLPHPLYLVPGVLPSDMTPEAYDRWCHILQFLTAVRSDEQMLDTLFEWGTGGVPFDDRWNWRHHVHMPQDFWQDFEQLSRLALGRRVSHKKPTNRLNPEHDNLLMKLHDINAAPARPLDFRWERVDIQLSEKDPWDLPIAVLPYGRNAQATSDIDGQAEMHKQKLDKLFKVRMGQISNEPDWKTIVRRGLQLNRNEIQSIMSQVGAVFLHESEKFKTDNGEERCEGMIVLPEVTIPNTERRTIMNWARERRHAVLAGCLWRPLATAMPPHVAIRAERVHLVNEAVLALPLADGGNEKWAPVRQFTLRKPIPAPIEQGLGRALTQNDVPGRTWHMLAGSRWYRFVHQRWGSFSVAICADLIDPAPWNTMRGLIQHLITCAYNKDIDLYEAMTWVRAYENFTNVVLVNHGKYGGSFVWTPRHSQGKELIRLRGKNLNLVADVELPVEDLITAQRDGLEYAIRKAEKYWLSEKMEPGPENDVLKAFKSPPPGYRNQNK